jgi:ankyrin repeat protein
LLLFTLALIVADGQTLASPQSGLLLDAAGRGDKELVSRLLAGGADVNEKDRRGWTPVFAATAGGHAEIAELLLARGADANVKQESNGVTVLHTAVSGANAEIAKLLLAHGADVNAKMHEGDGTALHVAAARGNAKIVAVLLAHGADVNAKCHAEGHEGDTPLHFAQMQREWRTAKSRSRHQRDRLGEGAFVEATKLLLAGGAAVNAKNDKGKTALGLAENKEMKALLKEYGAK